MNHIRHGTRWCAALALAASVALSAVAAPGAHGPNGEHLDGPASAGGSADTSPRMESKSEAFELVATLGDGELSLLIDRYETNEPVLDARVEVESGKLKAVAKFHADHGDYAVDDPALLQALKQPGSHPIVVTVVAAKDTDLLEGTLEVAGHAHEAAHADADWLRPTLIIAAFTLLGGAGFWWQRRQRRAAVEMSR
jgi:hypothetical protein